MPKVHILSSDRLFDEMFTSRGWEIVDAIQDADLIQYTGGADIDPRLYGQGMHPKTFASPRRDMAEQAIFCLALDFEIPQAGICRGGQFLNVMCGGSMFQDVNAHAIAGVHAIVDKATGEVFNGTSTHHQMMRPSNDAEILATASESTRREYMPINAARPVVYTGAFHDDIEALFYEKQRVLCFQPHPEYTGHKALADKYFEYIDTYLEI